ncbi:hypothetical protein H2203_002408 [Taxawa tesnikishii (nom. ined.)]|nr:hypothetical protein H2203_002408 [Dothideales sp. JES 119]
MVSNRSHTAPNNVPTANQDEAEMEAYTQSLKQLLNVQSRDSGLSTPDRLQHTSSYGNHGSPFQATPPQHGQADGSNGASNSLHYGNRNLSPLFQAARNDSPSRPSGLRQQFGYDNTQSPTAHRQYQQYASPPHQPQHHHHGPHQIDPNSFSQAYVLEQQAAAAQPFSSSSRSHQEQSFPPTQAQSYGFDQQHVPGVQGLDRPPSGSPDVKSMEDNLRRMLKLNLA